MILTVILLTPVLNAGEVTQYLLGKFKMGYYSGVNSQGKKGCRVRVYDPNPAPTTNASTMAVFGVEVKSADNVSSSRYQLNEDIIIGRRGDCPTLRKFEKGFSVYNAPRYRPCRSNASRSNQGGLNVLINKDSVQFTIIDTDRIPVQICSVDKSALKE